MVKFLKKLFSQPTPKVVSASIIRDSYGHTAVVLHEKVIGRICRRRVHLSAAVSEIRELGFDGPIKLEDRVKHEVTTIPGLPGYKF